MAEGRARVANEGKPLPRYRLRLQEKALVPLWFAFDYYFSLVIFWVIEEAAAFIFYPSSL